MSDGPRQSRADAAAREPRARRRRLLRDLSAALAAVALTPARAQQDAWPTRPIRLVVPFAAGGPADLVARELAEPLSRDLKQPVLIENQGGGGGVPALNTVSRSVPDGHTLLFVASGNVVLQPLLAKKRVDVLTQLAPVGMVTTSPHVLVVSGKLPARTLREFIDQARARPGSTIFASAGIGGMAHLAAERFARAAGIEIRHVPYKGTSQALADLAGGEVQAMFSSLPSMQGMIDKGAVRVLGVTAASPSPAYAGMPVIKDAGVPGFEYATWYGLFGPVDLPASVIQRLGEALGRLAADRTLDARLDAQGVDLAVTGAVELADRTRRESARWEAVIRDARIDLN